MANLSFAVADNAHDDHAIELPESVGSISFKLELLFAELAPCLKIIGIAAVFDEPCRCRFTLQQVPTDYGRNSLAMRTAINQHWLDRCH